MKKLFVTGDFNLPEGFALHFDLRHLRSPKSESDIREGLRECWGYVIGGPEYLSENILKIATKLQKVVVLGTGTNSFVDLEAARKRGISVCHTPGINVDAVAEFAIGSLIMSAAGGFKSIHLLKEGNWYQKPHKSLSDIGIGIYGLGNIGTAFARKLRLLGATKLSYTSRTRKTMLEKELSLNFCSAQDLFSRNDVVSVHLQYAPETHHIVNSNLLKKARPELIMLNFSNPNVFDPTALRYFLREGSGFAFFDGYYREWVYNKGLSKDNEGLLCLGPEKFVASSHIAAQEESTIQELLQVALSKLRKEEDDD